MVRDSEISFHANVMCLIFTAQVPGCGKFRSGSKKHAFLLHIHHIQQTEKKENGRPECIEMRHDVQSQDA
jgi:hypothetical protein